jgi:hypothetical protein
MAVRWRDEDDEPRYEPEPPDPEPPPEVLALAFDMFAWRSSIVAELGTTPPKTPDEFSAYFKRLIDATTEALYQGKGTATPLATLTHIAATAVLWIEHIKTTQRFHLMIVRGFDIDDDIPF